MDGGEYFCFECSVCGGEYSFAGANMRFLNVSTNLHFPLTHQPDDKLSLFHALGQGKIVMERHKGHLVSRPL